MSAYFPGYSFRRGEEHLFLGREITEPRDFSKHAARILDEEIAGLVGDTDLQIAGPLQENRPDLEALATALLENETLERENMASIIGRGTEAARNRETENMSRATSYGWNKRPTVAWLGLDRLSAQHPPQPPRPPPPEPPPDSPPPKEPPPHPPQPAMPLV